MSIDSILLLSVAPVLALLAWVLAYRARRSRLRATLIWAPDRAAVRTGRGGPWLLGEHFSALDPYAFMLCRWTRSAQRPARTLPHLAPYLQRVLARPATQRVIAREQLGAPLV